MILQEAVNWILAMKLNLNPVFFYENLFTISFSINTLFYLKMAERVDITRLQNYLQRNRLYDKKSVALFHIFKIKILLSCCLKKKQVS